MHVILCLKRATHFWLSINLPAFSGVCYVVWNNMILPGSWMPTKHVELFLGAPNIVNVCHLPLIRWSSSTFLFLTSAPVMKIPKTFSWSRVIFQPPKVVFSSILLWSPLSTSLCFLFLFYTLLKIFFNFLHPIFHSDHLLYSSLSILTLSSSNDTVELYVFIMSRRRFRVNPHSIVAWMSSNSI